MFFNSNDEQELFAKAELDFNELGDCLADDVTAHDIATSLTGNLNEETIPFRNKRYSISKA